jgi:hypothetical protein
MGLQDRFQVGPGGVIPVWQGEQTGGLIDCQDVVIRPQDEIA